MVFIRASANPPMDQSNPDNVFDLLSYINREQYGNRPLLYGQSFDAPMISNKRTKPVYVKKDGKYIIADYKIEVDFDPRFTDSFTSDCHTIFPNGHIPILKLQLIGMFLFKGFH